MNVEFSVTELLFNLNVKLCKLKFELYLSLSPQEKHQWPRFKVSSYKKSGYGISVLPALKAGIP